MPAERSPRVRKTPIPTSARLVVRGDELVESLLRADAARLFRRYPEWRRFGVSGFVATDDSEVDALCQTRLERFATVILFERAALEATGVEVVPTFRTPHVTIAHHDLDSLVAALLSCDHVSIANPYHDPGAR